MKSLLLGILFTLAAHTLAADTVIPNTAWNKH